MHISTIGLMIVTEVLLIVAAGCVLLVVQNRRLRALSRRLQKRLSELMDNLRAQQDDPAPSPPSQGETYAESLERQLALTREYHQSLDAGQNIALDLDMETPMPRRVAALRYAMLIAERDAQGDEAAAPDWDKLASRYQQLTEYYAPSTSEAPEATEDAAELDILKQDLLSYQKRVVNLEKFKKLYFELEERWESCSEKAQSHYDELSGMASGLDESTAFEEKLNNYYAAYQDITNLIEQNAATLASDSNNTRTAQQATGEIRRLRDVTTDQHRLIQELQQKLKNATTQEETNEVIQVLQDDLNQQSRYAQESETCIQLLEDEVNSAHQETEQARKKLQQLGLLKVEYKELQTHKDKQEALIYTIKSENQQLRNKVRALVQASRNSADDQVLEFKKALSQLKVKYAELEERYLKLKG